MLDRNASQASALRRRLLGSETAARLRARAVVLLPFYTAALVVLVAGISAVNSTLDDPGLTTASTALCVFGTLVSYALRVLGVQQRAVTLLSLVAVGAFVANANRIATAAFLFLNQREIDPASASALGLLLQWATVAFSFTMVTNQSVLFAVVPSMALLGLMSSENLNPEMVTYFLAFVLATVFLMGYDRCLSRTAEEDTSGVKPTVRSLLAVSVAIVAGSAILGALAAAPLRLAGRTVLSSAADRLSDAGIVLIRPLVGPGTEVLSLGGSTPTFTGRVVMRVRCPVPLYWRSQSFSYYNGSEWHVGGGLFDPARQGRWFVPRAGGGPDGAQSVFRFDTDLIRQETGFARRRVTQHYEVDVLLPGPVYAASVPIEVTGPFDEIVTDSHLDLIASAGRPVTEYTVVSSVSVATADQLRAAFDRLSEQELFEYQSRVWIPRVPQRVFDLVWEITTGRPTPYDQVLAIQQYIQRNCTYTLNPPLLPPDTDATEFFLFKSKAGYCEQFASAMAVMCRIAGLRSRVSVGYATGTWDPKDRCWVVRDDDAHAWVEVEFPGYGWIPFDPTAGVRVERDSFFSIKRVVAQIAGLIMSRKLMPTLMVALLVAAAAYALGTLLAGKRVWRRMQEMVKTLRTALRPDARAELMRLYRSLCRLLAGRSGMPKASETPYEFLRRVACQTDGTVLPAVTAVVEAYISSAYGGVEPDGSTIAEVRRNVQTVARTLRQKRRLNRMGTQGGSSVA